MLALPPMAGRKESRVQRLGHYLSYLVVRVVICAAQALSLSTCHTAARGLAFLFNDVLRIRGKVVEENLRHAFTEWSPAWRRRLARRMWEHLFLFAVEVAHTSRKIHGSNWRRHIRMGDAQSEAALVRCVLDDRPLIMVASHFGNFELAGYILALLGYPVHTVARTLDNPFLDRFVNTFRGSTGQKILSKRGDLDKITDVLAGGGIMTFVADQYAGRKGCWVDFFSRPASAHKAIAILSLEHEAPLLVGHCRRVGGPLQYELHVTGVADPSSGDSHASGVRELTEWYTRQFEEKIRQSPEQYWWLHRRWKDNRPKRRSRAKAA